MLVTLMTGSNSGIGLATTLHLAGRGHSGFAVCKRGAPSSPHLYPGKTDRGNPTLVAEAIESAITANEPRMRYLAGLDASVIVDGRARMGDEAWAAMGRHATDEEYFQEFSARFPAPA